MSWILRYYENSWLYKWKTCLNKAIALVEKMETIYLWFLHHRSGSVQVSWTELGQTWASMSPPKGLSFLQLKLAEVVCIHQQPLKASECLLWFVVKTRSDLLCLKKHCGGGSSRGLVKGETPVVFRTQVGSKNHRFHYLRFSVSTGSLGLTLSQIQRHHLYWWQIAYWVL